jgi:hypothetical protein
MLYVHTGFREPTMSPLIARLGWPFGLPYRMLRERNSRPQPTHQLGRLDARSSLLLAIGAEPVTRYGGLPAGRYLRYGSRFI